LPVRIADLAFFDADRFVVDTGGYRLAAGSSSMDIRSTVDFTVAGELTPVPVALTARPVIAGEDGISQRLTFPAGVEIAPRLTVAMNDDIRHGFGPGTPLPDGMTVAYRTNRPSVVTADPDGTVRTVGPGVGTVTAIVTVNGGSASTEFVVVVR
jgi:beta-glucosidase